MFSPERTQLGVQGAARGGGSASRPGYVRNRGISCGVKSSSSLEVTGFLKNGSEIHIT